jgi:ethanolamine utilization protein EutN
MRLARVIGRLVATHKYKGLEGKRFMIVEPLSPDRQPLGGYEVAVDSVLAGPGDTVFLVGSREASLALDPWFVPVDSAIVGIVDRVDVDEAVVRELHEEATP